MLVQDGPLTGVVTSGAPPASRERAELAATARAVLTRHPAPDPSVQDALGDYCVPLWERLCEVGVPGLAIPEDRGGLGGSYLDAHAVAVELGAQVVASPMLASLLAGQALLLADAAEPRATDLLQALAEGTCGALVSGLAAHGDSHLDGVAPLVLDGARAQILLAVAAMPDGVGLFELARERLQREVLTTMDQAVQLARVTATQAPARFLGTFSQEAHQRLVALRTVALSAEQIGGARQLLDLTVQYVGQRIQFGRPIGSFQAIKHVLADLLVLVEAAESASWGAAQAWAADAPDAPVLAQVAGAYCGQAYLQVAAQCVQLHGGIAITWEHRAHRYLKHAQTLATLGGTPAQHRTALVARMRQAVAQ